VRVIVNKAQYVCMLEGVCGCLLMFLHLSVVCLWHYGHMSAALTAYNVMFLYMSVLRSHAVICCPYCKYAMQVFYYCIVMFPR